MNLRGLRLLCCLVLFAVSLGGVCAQTAHIDLGAVERSQPLLRELSMLVDATGARSPEEVARSDALVPVSAGSMRVGFTSATIWLRARIVNDSATTQTRWLSIGDARLEYVDFFQFDATGTRIKTTSSGGTARPLHTRPVTGKESLFPVKLAPGEHGLLLIRVSGRQLISLDAAIWDPLHYREHETARDLQILPAAASLLALSTYLLLGALSSRDKPLSLLSMWLCAAVIGELTMRGYLYRFLLTEGGESVLRAPVLILSISLALATGFVHALLHPSMSRLLRGTFRCLCITGMALALCAPFGNLRVMVTIYLCAITLMFVAFLFVFRLAWRCRTANMRLFTLALGGLWATTLGRLLMMLGAVSANWVSSGKLLMLYMLAMACFTIAWAVQRRMKQDSETAREHMVQIERQRAEQVRLESAIQARTRALEEALIAANEANRAKSDFLARISHDLRAPLTSILGYAEMVIGLGGRHADSGRTIHRSARHLLALLNDLTDYARGGSQPHSLQALPIYLRGLLANIAAEGESLARRNSNRFECTLEDDLPAVIEVDEKRLRQILGNLLDNAAKFTANGTIRFTASCTTNDGAAEDSVTVALVIEDTGPGMPAAELVHIFEPFRRLKSTESHEGLGLGLAISKQWVDRMGGEILAESTPGKGTRIRVSLPLRIAPEDALSYPQQTCCEENLPDLDGANRTVWVVEDSHEIRTMLCLELRSQGFVPVPIGNGHDAISMLNSQSTQPPDLVLTDLRMPFAGGEEVLAKVRSKWPDLPVVLLTATPDATLPAADEFSAILSKPVSMALLRRTLASQLGISFCMAPPVEARGVATTYPDARSLREAQSLIQMGAISDLIDWAQRLVTRSPALTEFAERATQLAERGELDRLRALCAGHDPTLS